MQQLPPLGTYALLAALVLVEGILVVSPFVPTLGPLLVSGALCYAGVLEPWWVVLAAVVVAPLLRKALAKADMSIDQIDLIEINEAFAAVPLRFMREFDVPHDKVNVNGGAIAMGHPLGATGAMILGTVLDELERREQRYGLATLCVGGGMGIATIVERLS